MPKTIPVEKMYEQRQNFVVVALTGITGSGCSDFADLMGSPFEAWREQIRNLEEAGRGADMSRKEDVVFMREYQTCYNFSEKNYKPFQAIKYKNVVILYMLDELAHSSALYEEFVDRIVALLKYKFHHSHEGHDQITYDINDQFSRENVESWGSTKQLYDTLRSLNIEENGDRYAEFFFCKEFNDFCNDLYEDLKKRDYYAKNFFVHRLATAIRATGKSEAKKPDFEKKIDNDHIFDLVELINVIIKGYHIWKKDDVRRFVIDSVRNSLEILYLRERYNSFYMIALHNDGREEALLKEKVAKYVGNAESTTQICKNIMSLSKTEDDIDDFEKGKFYSPDISRCVSESELHIAYNNKKVIVEVNEREEQIRSFYSYGEQWMKYSALIARPGLVTPTRDERCMSIAYVAKFNSGCISRQVGCTIVDKENAVQSVGWNDPPSPQLPCNLRYVDELWRTRQPKSVLLGDYRIYSRFENVDERHYKWTIKKTDGQEIEKEGDGFCSCLHCDIGDDTVAKVKDEGLPYSYCFRSRYNTYKGNKDAVNTRSLHAEENTMLRISRRGGIGLDGGTMYVTASPCVLCSKKAYQIGIKDIVYLDPYTDIAPDLILNCGFDIPNLRPFRGAIGGTFYKLYQPFLPYKDELSIYEKMV